MQSMGPAQEEQDQTSHAEQSEPVWAMNAEVQTCSTSQAPVWADNQFSCLELQLDAQQQHSMAAESTWIEVYIALTQLCLG